MRKILRKKRDTNMSFKIIGYACLTLIALLCIIPMLLIVSNSLTTEESIYQHGYSFFPRQFSLQGYKIVFSSSWKVFKAYLVSITITVAGTALSLIVTSLTAYVIWRKDFPYRRIVALFIYFTMVFTGGLIPLYIWVVRYLHLKNSLLALILPNLTTAIYIFILRNYLRSVPEALVESAKIDGANEFIIYLKIILPVSMPGLAAVGLFQALYYWNDWFLARLFIENESLMPLQFFLYRILNNLQAMNSSVASSGIPLPEMPTQTIKMVMVVVTTGPILFLFPFIQKYFIKGITIGSIKE